MMIKKMVTENDEILDTTVYVEKRGAFKYLKLAGMDSLKGPNEKRTCPLCNERHKLKAHHLIPRRLSRGKGALAELRIHICDTCHERIHPENKYIRTMRKLGPGLVDITNGAIKKLPAWKELEAIMKAE